MTIRLASLLMTVVLLPTLCRAGELTFAPAAEISAVKSPVKLTLSVYKTRLKLQDDFKVDIDYERLDKEHPRDVDDHAQDGIDFEKYERRIPIKVGEPVWIKLRLTNVGKKPMVVMDDLFTGPMNFQEALESNSRYGVSIVITGPDGKDLIWDKGRNSPLIPCSEAGAIYDPVGTKKAAEWRKQGKSAEQIDELLEKDLRAEEKKKRDWALSHHPVKKLQPGESIATGPWRYAGGCGRQEALLPAQIGDYAQLWNYRLDAPGRYKIRAVYFDDPFRRSGGTEIGFKTPAITLTVLP